VAFSIEDDFFDELNKALEAAGIKANGYGWLDVIENHLTKRNPDLLERLNCLDTELATCVIWVESEADCRELIEAIWTILRDPNGPLPGTA
jgi:Immunity protein 51